MSNNQNMDNFLENLQDLNEVTKQITSEMEKQNQILKGGLADNEKYRQLIDTQKVRFQKHK